MTENAKWTPPPPTIPPGMSARWDGEQWILEEVIIPESPPDNRPRITDIDRCKMLAKAYLLDTDYAMLPDVKISNRSEFEVYRTQIRELYLNPVEKPVWPQVPRPQWVE